MPVKHHLASRLWGVFLGKTILPCLQAKNSTRQYGFCLQAQLVELFRLNFLCLQTYLLTDTIITIGYHLVASDILLGNFAGTVLSTGSMVRPSQQAQVLPVLSSELDTGLRRHSPIRGQGRCVPQRGSCLRVEGRLNLSYPEFDNSEKLGNASIAPSLAPTSLGTYGSPSVAHASISQPSGQESYSTIACAKLFRLACGTRGLPHHQTE